MKLAPPSYRLLFGLVLTAMPPLALAPSALHAFDLHFDYTSFETGFGQAQFDVLNYPSINGNYMMTSTDNHRPEMVANGNNLAQFYNNFLADYNTQHRNGAIDAIAEADAIHQYTLRNSTKNGPRPNWLILNEISASLWPPNPGPPGNSVYRQWVVDCVTRLHDQYGYNVVTFSPFQNPGANDASWQALSEVSFIGIECYLSGPEVWNSGGDYASRLAWAQGQYQASKNSYLNRGVPENRLFLGEHFANNNAVLDNGTPVTWGRAGLASAAAWDSVIQIRQDAIFNVGFDGFLAYNWGGNGMGVSQAEQIQHEYYYRSRRVLASQKPQWLPDAPIIVNGAAVPLSWAQPLNWLGGVPNSIGAEANFWRTLTANRAITLDGNKTVGRLTFDSPFSYTIAPGGGGSLTLHNLGAAASLDVHQGAHTISAPVHLGSSLNVAVSAGGAATLSGGLSGPGGVAKTGAGVLSLSGVINYLGTTTVAGGTLRLGGSMSAIGGEVTIGANGVLEASGTLARSVVNDGRIISPALVGQQLRLAGDVAGDGDYDGAVAFANRLSPGEGAALIAMDDVTFEATNTLHMQLGGPVKGAQYDHLEVSGRLNTGGRLVVSLINEFAPMPGVAFDLFDWQSMSGVFDAIDLPAVPGFVWDDSRLYLDGTLSLLLPGDFNADGAVDGLDIAAWRNGFGATVEARRAQGDAEGDHDVDGADFLAWQQGVSMAPAALMVAEPVGGLRQVALFIAASVIYRLRPHESFGRPQHHSGGRRWRSVCPAAT